MDAGTECTSTMENAGQNPSGKRKFFHWAVKWFYANMIEDNINKPDVPPLVSLLQSIGFQLREFQKIDESSSEEKSKPSNGAVRVFVDCGTSGMRACLELKDVECKCPNSEITKDASFWSVSGVGPTAATKVESTNKIEESGSNLLPILSKETNKILHDVMHHLLNIIADSKNSDINQNCQNSSNLNLTRTIRDEKLKNDMAKVENGQTSWVRSYTQPEILLPVKRNSITGVRSLNMRSLEKNDREMRTAEGDNEERKKWSILDIDINDPDQPRPSPPKIASSPVFISQLCTSLGQISLQSDEDAGSVAELVVRARKNLDRALELLSKKSPSSRNSSSRDVKTFLKPAPGGLNLTGGSRRQSTSSNGSLRSPTSGGPKPRPNSRNALPTREISTPRSRMSLAMPVKVPSSTSGSISRRSTGATAMSTSMIAGSSNIGAPKRSSNIEQHSATESKIPPRRNSFSIASGGNSLKLSIASARNAALIAKKTSPEYTGIGANKSIASLKANPSANNQTAGSSGKFGFAKKKSSMS